MSLRVHQLLKDIVNQDDYEYSPMQFRIFRKEQDGTVSLLTQGGKHKKWGYHSVLHSDEVFTQFP